MDKIPFYHQIGILYGEMNRQRENTRNICININKNKSIVFEEEIMKSIMKIIRRKVIEIEKKKNH